MVKFAVDKGREQEPETQPVVLICLLPQILVGITHVHPISCKVREEQTLRKIKKNKSYGLCLQLTRINKLTANRLYIKLQFISNVWVQVIGCTKY